MPVFDIYDDNTHRRIEADSKRISFGRTPDNTIFVDDRQTSRRHCEVRLSEIGYILRDLKSRNGTKLNDEPIDRPMSLRDGDEIGIGKAIIRFWSAPTKIPSDAPDLPCFTVANQIRYTANLDLNLSPPQPQAKSKPQPHPAVDIPVTPQPQTESTSPADDLDLKIVASDVPPAGFTKRKSGPLDINDIIPLNRDGKPAHAIGKDASEVSAAMLRLKQLLLRAFQFAATDIHIEPQERDIRIRYRIDGCLHQTAAIDPTVARPVYSIVKLLCNIDINKRGVLQDGGFSVQLPDRRVDLRISLAPATQGDKMVVRILDRNLAPRGLDDIGMEPYILEQVRRKAASDSSMMIICGPTGSGKTTTVYAIIRELNAREKNIVTVEDPVEYKLEDITQIQVNARAGVTFAGALASLLRQDPDVILVGEIRDADTARMAVQSAMTGHLVLTTIHARDSIGSIFRLLDLGVEPFLLGSALTNVLSQRLLRTLCPRCKMRYKPAVRDLARCGVEDIAGTDLYASVGCEECMNIGYKGRQAVFELLTVNDQVRDAVVHKPTIQQLRAAAGDWIFQTLREDALRKLKAGLISLDEFNSATPRES
ncbi:MAG: Flp pilus assembly complex ATPase component TadA [Sedimentisphaerales bacterium]|nr:Flp pilus assembly complex ATPase component TadA [Sedimentisphaerales bacterium]